MTQRPSTLVVVAGTDTGIGKTWVTASAAAALRSRGASVAARKPVQSFSHGEFGSTDADLLAAATGEPVELVCPAHRWYEVPMAPPMAAEVLGRPPFTIADIAGELVESWVDETSVGFVELAGGPRSPVAVDGDNIDLTFAIRPDVVWLVADAGLGTINAVRLCVDALRPIDEDRIVVVLNRFDDNEELHHLNAEWLSDHFGYDVVTNTAELTERLAPS